MEIENIPSDENIEMTAFFHRAFNAAGCNPMCHCCKNMLPVGSIFKLGTIETQPHIRMPKSYGIHKTEKVGTVQSKEVMLCENCSPEDYKYFESKMFEEAEKEYNRRVELHRQNGGGCFRINGKIVH